MMPMHHEYKGIVKSLCNNVQWKGMKEEVASGQKSNLLQSPFDIKKQQEELQEELQEPISWFTSKNG